MDMISLHHINKSYGSHQVLNNVDLTINRGEIYGLIGKNGVGKIMIQENLVLQGVIKRYLLGIIEERSVSLLIRTSLSI